MLPEGVPFNYYKGGPDDVSDYVRPNYLSMKKETYVRHLTGKLCLDRPLPQTNVFSKL